MIEQIREGVKNNVVALSAHGKVSHQDYERVLIPSVEEKIRLHSKIRFLFVLADDFEGYTAEAIWDDTKVGLQHITAFEKRYLANCLRMDSNSSRRLGLVFG